MRHFASLIAILTLWLAACKGTIAPAPYDKTFDLKGVVYDPSTDKPIAGVTISWKEPDKADSLVFCGDTLTTAWNQVLPKNVQTSAEGTFLLEFVPCARDTSRYRYLFAVKAGYKLWRFSLSPVPVSPVDERSDFTRIPLTSL